MGRRRKGLQYAVVYLPDGTLNPEAVGPFYSPARAQEAADAIDAAVDDDDIQTPTTVVTLHTLESALRELRR
jgi:hypothetical protein